MYSGDSAGAVGFGLNEGGEQRPHERAPADCAGAVGSGLNEDGGAGTPMGYVSAKFFKSASPAAWLFSGWNWVAKMLSRQMAAQNGRP